MNASREEQVAGCLSGQCLGMHQPAPVRDGEGRRGLRHRRPGAPR